MYLKVYKKAAMIIMTAASERMTGLGPIRLFFAPSLYKGMRMAFFSRQKEKILQKRYLLIFFRKLMQIIKAFIWFVQDSMIPAECSEQVH